MNCVLYSLTGGIACGKSVIGEMLAGAGWHVIDTDIVAHRLMEPGQPNWQKVVDAFGRSILNGDASINRRLLGDLVFSEPALRDQLNALVHPGIREAWQTEVAARQSQAPHVPVIVIIPLLYEAGLETLFGHVIAAGCAPATQAARMRQRGLTEAQVRQRLASQWPLSRKLAASQTALWNDGSIEALRRQVTHWVALRRAAAIVS